MSVAPGKLCLGHSGVSQATELSEESMRTRDAATSTLLIRRLFGLRIPRAPFERQPTDCAECQLCGAFEPDAGPASAGEVAAKAFSVLPSRSS